MSDTVENKQARLERLKAKQQELLDRAKAVQKRIARAESADREKRRKEDNRTKLLLGVAVLEAAKYNAQVRQALLDAVPKLRDNEREFMLNESELWAELLAAWSQAAHNHAASA